ncbi:MAG: hypothetical protein MPN21_21050 [Thermoanaerobaculia bacterium]|nr:hypothetical protein [Thermoanaerobaculia bacterium]
MRTYPFRKAQAVLSALFVATFLFTASASAQTVLMDLGDNFSDMSAQNWNTMIFNQAVPDLVDDTGTSTGISFTPLFWGGDFQNSANWIEDTDWVLQEAATDHFGGFSNSTITLGNLDGLYRLEVVCSHPQTNHLTDITVNDSFADRNFQNIPGVNGDDFDPEQDGRVAKNWLIWDDVEPVGGNITLRVIKLAGTNAISVGALRLTRTGDLVPEPDPTVTKTASPENLPEPGGSVNFTVRIDNSASISADMTSLTDTVAGNLDGQGDCSLPQTIAASGFYECTYSAMVTGDPGDSETRTTTASGSLTGEGAFSVGDSATVTITDALPSGSVTKTASPTEVDEPGGNVTFSVTVDNLGTGESLSLTALVDDIHGDLNGQGTCSVPQTIAPSGSYSCSFTVAINGAGGDSETDTVTATLSDDEANSITPSDSATVNIIDLMPQGYVNKATTGCAGDVSLEPGGTNDFQVTVLNTGEESVELTDLFDDMYGDLNGQGTCSVPQTIAPGSSYTCRFSGSFTGSAGDSESSELTATIEDDEMNIDTPTHTLVLEILAPEDVLLVDCFEAGNTDAWSVVVP